jgi:hypothetical protein
VAFLTHFGNLIGHISAFENSMAILKSTVSLWEFFIFFPKKEKRKERICGKQIRVVSDVHIKMGVWKII